MKKMTTRKSRAGVALALLLAASTTAIACSIAWLPLYVGVGQFGSKKPDVSKMGDTAPYLAGATINDMVVQWRNYDASCSPLSYDFWGTTPQGHTFTGIAEPSGGKGRKRGSSTPTKLNLTVVSIEIYDEDLGKFVSDDGGFGLQFTELP